MTYFLLYTRTRFSELCSELWTKDAIRKKQTSSVARRLSQRINLTAQACQIDSVACEHGNRLDCAGQPSSPHDIARRVVERESATRLNKHNPVAEHWRRRYNFAHDGFPPKAARLRV